MHQDALAWNLGLASISLFYCLVLFLDLLIPIDPKIEKSLSLPTRAVLVKLLFVDCIYKPTL